jgi:hypothetical protein
VRLVAEQARAAARVDAGDELRRHVHEARRDADHARERLVDLVPALDLVRGDVEGLAERLLSGRAARPDRARSPTRA